MDEKLKLLILGKEATQLKKTCERLEASHPVETFCYSDLKDFLEQSINAQPDIVGISFSYPHKSITQFPKIIEMAINIPVIIFSEDRDNKVLQAIMNSRSPYKITGGMTAQNLWVQI
jgi:AmiR/NasT family two-component response regulator